MMNLNNVKPEYHAELTGAMTKLFAMQQEGRLTISAFLAAQQRLFNTYEKLSLYGRELNGVCA